MIHNVGINFDGKNNFYKSTKKTHCSIVKKQTTLSQAKKLDLPYYTPVSFTGTRNNMITELKDNNCSITALDTVAKLPNKEKQDFLKQYCKKTGFPNLETVNKRIILHANKALNVASKNAGLPVLWSGYHKNCSVSKNLALPGSDLDGWSVIVDGNKQEIDKFKGELWQNTNPLFVSIRGEFPYIYGLDQAYEWTKFIDEIVIKNGLDKKEEQYKQNLCELDDFEKAIMFNIDIRKYIEGYNIKELKKKTPSLSEEIEDKIKYRKSNNETSDIVPVWITSDLSTCLETLRNGNVLTDSKNLSSEQKYKFEKIKNSYLYKYGNMSMQELGPILKPKLIQRQVIDEQWFEKLSCDEKFNLISKMIYTSYSANDKTSYKEKYDGIFKSMFDNGEDLNKARSKAISKACG